MPAHANSPAKTIRKVAFFLRVHWAWCNTTIFIEMACGIEVRGVFPVCFTISVEMPYIGNDNGALGNKLALFTRR